MKWLTRLKFGTLLAAVLAMTIQARAAVGFDFSISNSPVVGQVNSNLTFNFVVTNSSSLNMSLLVTNTLPLPFSFQPASSPGWVSVGPNQIFLGTNIPPGTFSVPYVVTPSASGTFSTFVEIFSPNAFPTPFDLTTNVSTTIGGASTDLGVALSVPATAVILGDQTSYSIIVTNIGPGAAGNFFVTNTLPAGLKFVSVTPGTGATTTNAGKVILNVTGLNPGSAQTYNVAVTPTNAGTQTITAVINPLNLTDSNLANNSATTNITVTAPNTNQVVTTVSSPVFNPQTGLFNQTVSLSNTSDVAMASARLVVGGLLATNKLYNSVGTNNGNPFVVYPTSIAPGETATFLLEFYYPLRVPQTNLTYTSFAVARPNLSTTVTGTALALRIVDLEDSRVLIEFLAKKGKTYRIVYSDSSDFTNPLLAEPLIVAPADKVQWIDEGPPKTVSKPGDSGSRFYKVFAQ